MTAEGVLYDLLLLPVDKIDAGKVMLEVELDGKSLSAPFPVDAVDKWEAGKAYTYEVAVRNGAAQVVFGKATVTPWNDGGSHLGRPRPVEARIRRRRRAGLGRQRVGCRRRG